MDCAEMDGRPFFSVCGVGLDAEVSLRFAESGRRGLAGYVREALRVWRGFRPQTYALEVDGRPMKREAVLITAANSDQWGNGARIAPSSRCDDGFLDVAVLKPFRTVEIPALAFRLMTGRLEKSRKVEYLRCRSLVITRESAGPAHFDGECFEAGNRLEARLTGEKLRIICNKY